VDLKNGNGNDGVGSRLNEVDKLLPQISSLQIPRSPGYTKYRTFLVLAVKTQRVITYGTLNFHTPKSVPNLRVGQDDTCTESFTACFAAKYSA
jgi:hypothetical protein